MDYESVLAAVMADSRYQGNLDWGRPRSGHPEGSVRAHIAELEANLEQLRAKLSAEEVGKLKLLIHVHDSFKAEAKSAVPILHPASHASLARAFLAEFCDDGDLLAMVQYHDEPFALWRQVEARGSCSETRLQELLGKIRDWHLFLAFMIIDGCTEGKGRRPLQWFFQEVAGKVESRFCAADILPPSVSDKPANQDRG
jgi:hypothetical protein